jgi:signal peptidase I
MKKLFIVLGIVAGILFALYIAGRITGAFQHYHSAAGSMHPTITSNSFFVSNLVTPKRNDIIVFNHIAGENEVVEPGSKEKWVFRLMGMEGETIEIKNGLVYINDQLVDDSTHLCFMYHLPAKDLQKVIYLLDVDQDEPGNEFKMMPLNDSLAVACLSYDECNRYQCQDSRFIGPVRKTDFVGTVIKY